MSSALFQQVVEATRGEYVLHATLGQSDVLGTAFLAREVATGRTVVLMVPPDAESLDVVGALGETIPADAGACAACSFRVGTWVDACPRCEHSLLPPAGPSPEPAALAGQLHDSVEVVGGLPHLRGGTMYFGREPGDRRLTAFVVRPQGDAELALDVVWDAAEAPAPALAAVGAAGPVGAFGEAHDSSAGAWGGDGVGGRGGAFEGADPVVEHGVAPGGGGLDAPPRAGRRWLPIGLGVGALALAGAGAFALTRQGTKSAGPAVGADTTPHLGPNDVPPTGPVATTTPPPSAAGAAGGPAKPDSASVAPVVLTPEQQRWRDSVNAVRRAYRDSVRAARLAAATTGVLTIEGELPSGWSATVNGAGQTTAREIRVTPNEPALVRIQAPGYCSDTLRVRLAPQGRQHWSPTLRGRSIVEEC